MLAEFGRVRVRPGRRASAPGQTAGHYAPRTPLISRRTPAVTGGRLGTVGVPARRDAARRPLSSGWNILSETGDLREAAVRLFAALRRLDEAGLDGIIAEPVPETGLGRAIMERLRRAAAGSGAA